MTLAAEIRRPPSVGWLRIATANMTAKPANGGVRRRTITERLAWQLILSGH